MTAVSEKYNFIYYIINTNKKEEKSSSNFKTEHYKKGERENGKRK